MKFAPKLRQLNASDLLVVSVSHKGGRKLPGRHLGGRFKLAIIHSMLLKYS
jgi:hypothetical protein